MYISSFYFSVSCFSFSVSLLNVNISVTYFPCGDVGPSIARRAHQVSYGDVGPSIVRRAHLVFGVLILGIDFLVCLSQWSNLISCEASLFLCVIAASEVEGVVKF